MARSHEGAPRSAAAGLLTLARLKAGLSQRELGDRAGVPATMISAYERDKRQPTVATLMKLVHAAGFEVRMRLAPLPDVDSARSPGASRRARAVWSAATELPRRR